MPNLETSSLISRSTVTSREIFYSMTVDWAIPCHCHKTNLYLQSDALKCLQSSPISFRNCKSCARLQFWSCNNSHWEQMEFSWRTNLGARHLCFCLVTWRLGRWYFAELGQILGVRVWCYCSSSTIPQWRGDLRLAMTVIKVARGRGKGGRVNEAKLVCNESLMCAHN